MSTPEALIEAGGAVLAIDTNAVLGFRRLTALCNHVNLLRQPPDPLAIRLVVPAIVHMEVLFDLRQHHGGTFDAEQVVDGLLDKGLEIEPFARAHAEHAATRLARMFPENAAWHAAKKKRCLQCTGLLAQEHLAQASGKSCGATVDFAIAAHAAQEGWILVTDDKGPDFAGFEPKVNLAQLEAILAELLLRRRAEGSEPPASLS